MCKLISDNNADIKKTNRKRILHNIMSNNTMLYEILDDNGNIHTIPGAKATDYINHINEKRKLDNLPNISWHGLVKSKKKKSKGWSLKTKYKIPKDLLIQAEYQYDKLMQVLQNPSL